MIDKKLLAQLYKSDTVLAPLKEKIDKPRIPTISPSTNWSLQGGIVPGRFYCLFGPESSGKTMLAVSWCAELLKANPDKIVYWFDTEQVFGPPQENHWVKIFMSDERGFTEEDRTQRIVVVEAVYGKDIFDDFMDKYTRLHDDGLGIAGCVVDSLQAIIPPQEANRASTENQLIAPLSKYLPGALRRITKPSRDRDITWIFNSQVRDVLDPIQQRLGKKYEFTGGHSALHHIDALLLCEQMDGKANKVYSAEDKGTDDKEVQIGQYVKLKVLGKCRVGVPHRVGVFKFLYSQGIVDQWEEIAKLALNQGITKCEGKTYFYGDRKLGVGREDYDRTIKEDPELQSELYEQIIRKA